MTKRLTRSASLAYVAAEAFAELVSSQGAKYPLVKYQRDIIGYVTERLKVDQILPHQSEILVAIQRAVDDLDEAPSRVAVRSAVKTGKTKLAIWSCLWFYECFADARVFLCAAIIAQTKNVLWNELRQTLRLAREAGVDIDGEFAQSPEGGFVSRDMTRAIKGISGRDVEAVAGYSGRQLLVVDEASHLPQKKAEALEGNTMGGGCIQAWFSQPVRNDGPFYEAFHSQARWWQCFHLDAEQITKALADAGIVPPYGCTTLQRVEEAREQYGEQSPFWLTRVKGEWLRNETGRAITMAAIEEAVSRWHAIDGEGPLVIGYDCAGPGDGGDEHCWAVTRGRKCVALERARGYDEERALQRTSDLISAHRRGDEIPRVNIDAEGPIGSTLYGRLRAESQLRTQSGRERFDVFGIRGSSRHVRDATKFDRVRDELVWCLSEWIKDGGVPTDQKLHAELYAPTWHSMPDGRLRVTPKSELRDDLGRSPDSFDALALSVWKPTAWKAAESYADKAVRQDYRAPSSASRQVPAQQVFDPYASPFGRG